MVSASLRSAQNRGPPDLVRPIFRKGNNAFGVALIKGADTATQTHYAVGHVVRKAIEKIGGTMPEDLPTPDKSIQQIEKEQMERLQKKAKARKPMHLTMYIYDSRGKVVSPIKFL